MLKRLTLLAAVAALASACASNPAPTPVATTSGGAVVLTPGAAAGPATVLNVAASTQWMAEERLMPQDPILALVNTNGSVDSPAGFYMTCNPANGAITARLGKQAATRIGQTAMYSMRLGASARGLDGKFEKNPKSADADFVFTLPSADLRTIATLDMVSVLTDQGEVQWAFVKDPAAQVQAKYVASLKDIGVQTRDYLEFCNPK